MVRSRKPLKQQKQLEQLQAQPQHHVDDNFAHDPALIEASNTAAAALQAANAANHILNAVEGNNNNVDLKDNGVDVDVTDSYVDTRLTDDHHGLDAASAAAAAHGLTSNLDPAVVGMGLSGHGNGSTTATDEEAAKAVAAAAAAAAAVANAAAAVANGGPPDAGVDDVNINVEDDNDDEEHGNKPRFKRTAITHEQRKALREWFFSQDPRPSQAKSIIWFHENFGRVISQAAISHSLHDRYKHLDFAVGAPSSAFRQRSAQWPELEAILFDYLQAIEKKKGKSAFPSAVSGETLTKAAKTIWQQIPMYAEQNPPTFSNGWVSRFKGRYKTYKQYGDATAIDIRSIQQLTSNYTPDSIYTMDETSLFWRRPPTANTISRDRSKVTVILCTNASGTDKLPLWSIGRSREYRSLASINLPAIDSHWRSNENAWLTGSIMEEWLQAFYEHIGSKSVLLVMDNFSAHIQGLAESPPPSNVRVQFLPTNSISFFQPLDKGIIDQFKVFYRKHWLDYMCQSYAKGQNPLETVTMLEALRWAVKAWDHDIAPDSIRYAFHEASILPSLGKLGRQKNLSGSTNGSTAPLIIPGPSSNLITATSNNANNITANFPAPQLILEPSYGQLWQTQQLADMIDLDSFIGFSAEESVGVEDVDESEILQAIINYHLGLSQIEDEEDDSADPKMSDVAVDSDALLPSSGQVLSYLEVVMNYIERQPFTTRSQMRALEEIELELERRLGQ